MSRLRNAVFLAVAIPAALVWAPLDILGTLLTAAADGIDKGMKRLGDWRYRS